VLASGLVAGVLLTAATSGAQDPPSAATKSPPAKNAFALPIEMDFDYGAANGDALITRFLPLVAVPLGERWKLINLTLAVVADAPGGVPGSPGNPEPVPGPNVFGLGDLTDAVLFTPPTGSSRFVWGFGPAFTFPIATDARLGSGKWSAGPAFRVAWRPGKWNLGGLFVYLRSYAGDADRGDVEQLLIRGLIRRQLGNGWYLTSNPIITANGNAPSGQRWLVPLGGGIGKRLAIGSSEIAVAVHAYANVIKPDGAPDGLLRIDFVVPIPRGLRRAPTGPSASLVESRR
jgi:hypothetical protein